MSNLKSTTIENVTIAEVKEVDAFLKVYSNKSGSAEEIKAAVLQEYMGRLNEAGYDALIEKAKTYTQSGTIPTQQEWGLVRAEFREVGNKKIEKCRQRMEVACRNYSGTTSISDDTYENITPKQAELNVEHAESKFATAKQLRNIAAIVLGLAGFALLTLVAKSLAEGIIKNASSVIIQLVAGLFSLIGLVAGAVAGYALLTILVKSKRKERENALTTKNANIELIAKLQTEIRSAEADLKRVESQYGVEILAQTDFSAKVPKPTKKRTKKSDSQKEKLNKKAKTDESSAVEKDETANN